MLLNLLWLFGLSFSHTVLRFRGCHAKMTHLFKISHWALVLQKPFVISLSLCLKAANLIPHLLTGSKDNRCTRRNRRLFFGPLAAPQQEVMFGYKTKSRSIKFEYTQTVGIASTCFTGGDVDPVLSCDWFPPSLKIDTALKGLSCNCQWECGASKT